MARRRQRQPVARATGADICRDLAYVPRSRGTIATLAFEAESLIDIYENCLKALGPREHLKARLTLELLVTLDGPKAAIPDFIMELPQIGTLALESLGDIAKRESWRALEQSLDRVWNVKAASELGSAADWLRDGLTTSMADPNWP